MQSIPMILRRRGAAAMLLTTFALSACNTWVVQTAPPREVLQTQHEQVQVRTADGRKEVLNFPTLRGDRLTGLKAIAKPKGDAVLHQRQFTQAFDTLTFALADVSSVALARTSPARTAVFLGAMGGIVAAVLGASGQTSAGP